MPLVAAALGAVAAAVGAAAHGLGFPADMRDYSGAAEMLLDLGVRRVRLLTNNPAKVAGLARMGIEVVEVLPLQVRPNSHNLEYLKTKQEKLGHMISPEFLFGALDG